MATALAELVKERPEEPSDVAARVRAILSVPDGELSYEAAKLALDRLVDPSLNGEAVEDELDRLADQVRRFAGPDAQDGPKLGAIRRVIYESGSWNGHRPFRYNPDYPDGDHIPDKLLANYLRTRLGNCVSMPILMLVLAERVGVKLALVSAPRHIFLRYVAPDGGVFNIEATSGGLPARDEWFRGNFSMSDRALESGLYMRALSPREGAALMATTVLEQVHVARRYAETIAVAQAILDHDPLAGQVMAAQASAYGALILSEFSAKYPVPFLIPEALRPRYRLLCARNETLFARAEALGWQPE